MTGNSTSLKRFEKQVLGVKGNFFLDAMHGKEAVPLVLPDCSGMRKQEGLQTDSPFKGTSSVYLGIFQTSDP